MHLLFSRRCEYALQAVLYVALKPDGSWTSIRELAKVLKIPSHFLAKILRDLTRRGLLSSQKGPRGGFRLGMQASDMTPAHIVEAVGGLEFTRTCVLGFSECSADNPCAVHHQWEKLRDGIHEMLVSKSIAQLARDMRRPEYRSLTHC